LAGFVHLVMRADGFKRKVQVIGKALGDFLTDTVLIYALPCEPDGQRGGLCAFDSLGVVVGALSTALRLLQHFFLGIKCKSDGAHAHGGSVAIAVIRFMIFTKQPVIKHPAVAGFRIDIPPGDHLFGVTLTT